MVKHASSQQQQPSPSSPQSNSAQRSLQAHSRKIKHHNRKKQNRKAIKVNQQEQCMVQECIRENQDLFSSPPLELLDRYLILPKTDFHVRNLLSNAYPSPSHPQSQRYGLLNTYVQFMRQSKQLSLHRVGINSSHKNISVGYLVQNHNPNSIIEFPTPFQQLLYTQLHSKKHQVEQLVTIAAQQTLNLDQLSQNVHVPIQINEILSLMKMAVDLFKQLRTNVQFYTRRNGQMLNLLVDDPDSTYNNMQDEYLSRVIMQNFRLSLEEQNIDFLNYHKTLEWRQRQLQLSPQQKILNVAQFKQYLSRKKHKNRKSQKYFLKTPCAACFSDRDQLDNPIRHCPQCHLRVHQLCQKVSPRCDRCEFSRTSNQQKHQSGYCYICRRPSQKGLMVHAVTNTTPHRFGHSYCLLMHGMWKIKNKQIEGMFQQNQSIEQCIFCSKKGGILMKCRECGQSMHGMCAYLSGCTLELKEGQWGFRVQAVCCGPIESKQRLMHYRKLKLNFEKVLFRHDQGLFSYLQQHFPSK